MDFNIRGTTSINEGEPLILVDNVPFSGSLNLLNPNDIESVTVLKDAASASIYGARSAFGVILITTKGAQKEQKVQLTYSNNFSFKTNEFAGKSNSASDRSGIFRYGLYYLLFRSDSRYMAGFTS